MEKKQACSVPYVPTSKKTHRHCHVTPHTASAAVLSERRSITARQITVHGGQSKRGRHQSGQATRRITAGGHAKISPEPNNQPTGAGVWPAHVPADRTDGGHGSAAPAGPRAPSAVKRESRRLGCGPMGGAKADRRSRLTREQEAGEATGEGPRRVGLTTGTRGQARVVRSIAGQSFASLLPAVRRERFTARFDRVSPSSRVPDPGQVFLWPLPAGRRRGSLLTALTHRPRHARAVQVPAVGRIGGKGALYSCRHCHLPDGSCMQSSTCPELRGKKNLELQYNLQVCRLQPCENVSMGDRTYSTTIEAQFSVICVQTCHHKQANKKVAVVSHFFFVKREKCVDQFSTECVVAAARTYKMRNVSAQAVGLID